MVEKDVLKKILFFKDLPDIVFEKVGMIANLETFDEHTVLFDENHKLTHLYMLVSGKVYLSIKTASGKTLTLDKVMPGRTFGVAALTEEPSSSFAAVCAEKCSIITIPSDQLHKLFVEDFKIGHTLMFKVAQLFKLRIERHTRQFLKTLASYPEIKQL
ncbi:Crp/Fnr family transcriptional regulator [Desulfobacula phenolica]|uniref:Cyclic nucleotide-binding domain-containing protein n=1 Tax=Desulfobacula phenolica TaxID=90732 RepID=A0A1H2ELB5_9BACT|nr:cyclic nucleotide-binding domain-containing protein [Desulfobacula phenolica]SDT95962.1 Cyclic nucleotide-binding domain-containing protein [Desulfobacula phenolica]